jgi:ribonuclease BN (tRNA processing enzyme)
VGLSEHRSAAEERSDQGALSVVVLGCSGSYPAAGGACSGYLVSDGVTRVWVDAGSGTLANLQRHVAPPEVVDAVVLSHEHPDHWSDLDGFLNLLRFATERKGVPVYAPPGLRSRTYGDTAPELSWNDIDDGETARIGSLDFTFSRTDHGPLTLAMRIDGGGRSLGYSSDTGPAWSLEALGADLDLALCEATVPWSMEGQMQHLSARQAGAMARRAGAARLVLTHLWATVDPDESRREASEAFGAPVEVAAVHDRYDV